MFYTLYWAPTFWATLTGSMHFIFPLEIVQRTYCRDIDVRTDVTDKLVQSSNSTSERMDTSTYAFAQHTPKASYHQCYLLKLMCWIERSEMV